MFSNPVCNINNYHIYERHSYFCSVCRQRFLTEKNFNRHISSRKHIRQMQFFAMTSFRFVRRPNPIMTKLNLLPNEKIAELIDDLKDEIDHKKNFFNGIQLLEDNELDVINDSMTIQQPKLESKCMEISQEYETKMINLNGVQPTSPCFYCFQTLDSQQQFNDHMLRAHYNIGAENEF